MNTAVKIMSQQRVLVPENVGSKEENLVLRLPEVKSLLLLLTVLFSAILLVYIKDLNRQLFVNLQSEFSNYQQLQIDESKLLLEQSAWSNSLECSNWQKDNLICKFLRLQILLC